MHPKDLSISDFGYSLPNDRIAKYPLEQRDDSKLLVYNNGTITSSIYKNLDEVLPQETLLVFNNTKVVEARLLFEKLTGGVIEIFCLEPGEQYYDITSAMLQKGEVVWKCLVGGASKWKHGIVLEKKALVHETDIVLKATIADRLPDSFLIHFTWQPEILSFAEILHALGNIPLPPYLNRSVEEADKTRYQTVYAQLEGSVAAPTAGLHFTDAVFAKLAAKNIQHEFVTLHVGAGTFKPVKAEKMDDHEMHAEFIDVSAAAIRNLIKYLDKTIVAVGTTSLRTIESLYWMGLKVARQQKVLVDEISINQWDPYEMPTNGIAPKQALESLLHWMDDNALERLFSKTQILISPPYSLKIADGIITNFHQPQSTLLLLVSAITGDDWKKIYDYALANDFRFLSYGDGSLLWANRS